jgi:hypothetical protein
LNAGRRLRKAGTLLEEPFAEGFAAHANLVQVVHGRGPLGFVVASEAVVDYVIAAPRLGGMTQSGINHERGQDVAAFR